MEPSELLMAWREMYQEQPPEEFYLANGPAYWVAAGVWERSQSYAEACRVVYQLEFSMFQE